jgi:uncharacterized membrane protein YkvA (DUF1232 family)
MTNKSPAPYDPSGGLNILGGVVRRVRLVWLLFWDNQVPLWVKSVLPVSLIYLISPIDFIPDWFLGLGQLDDLGVILLGMALFVKLCPPDIVQKYLDQLEYGGVNDDDVVDTTYNIVDED